MTKRKRKAIEVVEGFISKGKTGYIEKDLRFGEWAWIFPIVYISSPNKETFRKVRITTEELP